MKQEVLSQKSAKRKTEQLSLVARYVSCERGFTFMETIVSLAILVLLFVGVIIILDPVKHFARGRNQERQAHLNLIINAVGQNIFDNRGTFSCSSGPIPTSATRMASSTGNYNVGPCLVPVYLNNLPVDPSTSSAIYVNENNYDTGYFMARNATTGRVTVSAPAAELGKNISVTR